MSKTLEELGYEKTEYETQTEYTYDHKIMGERFEHEILFSKPSKLVFIYGKRGIDMEELKAIYQCCIDNKWIDDERYNKGYQDGFKQAKFDCEMDKLDGR